MYGAYAHLRPAELVLQKGWSHEGDLLKGKHCTLHYPECIVFLKLLAIESNRIFHFTPVVHTNSGQVYSTFPMSTDLYQMYIYGCPTQCTLPSQH